MSHWRCERRNHGRLTGKRQSPFLLINMDHYLLNFESLSALRYQVLTSQVVETGDALF